MAIKHHSNENFLDSNKLIFGTGLDASLYVHGDNLYIDQDTADKDIIFRSDDGSGGTTAYLTLDGSSGYTKAHKHILYEDDAKAMFGTGGDMQILHDGSNTYISQNVTGNLYIQQNTNDADLILQCDDGSGGTTAYLTLDGSAVETKFNKDLRVIDNEKIIAGTSNDLEIFSSGADVIFKTWAGNMTFQQNHDDSDIIFQSDDGSGGTTNYFLLDGSQAQTRFEKNAQWGDSVIAKFGSAGDLQIQHDGSNSYIDQTGTGHLYIRNTTDDNDIIFQSDDGSGGTTAYLTLDGSTTHSYFSAGNVGIGTTSPATKLHVSKAESNDQLTLERTSTFTGKYTLHTASNNFYIGNTVAGSYPLAILNNGNVGIGTTSPDHLLQVESSGNAEIQAQRASGAGVLIQSQSAVGVVGTNTNHRLDLKTNSSTRATISTSGNFGIGTTSPGEKLDVDGDIKLSGDIELGHASDTTIARSAAGTVTIEGKTIATTNKTVAFFNSQFFNSSTSGFYAPFNYLFEGTSLSTSSYFSMISAPYDGKVLRVSSFTQSTSSKTTTVEMYLNGDDSDLTNDQVGTDLVISSYTQKNTGTCADDWVFSAGDALSFRITNSAAGSGQVLTFVIEFDLDT